MTVAPHNDTSMDSPVGRVAVTLVLSSEMLTCGCGASLGVAEMAEGLFERSTIACISNYSLFKLKLNRRNNDTVPL